MDTWMEKDYPWLIEEKKKIKEFVVDLKKPYLGFCLGCQLLGEVVGGKVVKSSNPEIGMLNINFSENKKNVFSGVWRFKHAGGILRCTALSSQSFSSFGAFPTPLVPDLMVFGPSWSLQEASRFLQRPPEASPARLFRGGRGRKDVEPKHNRNSNISNNICTYQNQRRIITRVVSIYSLGVVGPWGPGQAPWGPLGRPGAPSEP